MKNKLCKHWIFIPIQKLRNTRYSRIINIKMFSSFELKFVLFLLIRYKYFHKLKLKNIIERIIIK